MSGDTQHQWRPYRPGPLEFMMVVFVLMVLTLIQMLLVSEVVEPDLTTAEMEVFQFSYEILGLALVALFWSMIAIALEEFIPTVAAQFGHRAAYGSRAAIWLAGAVAIVGPQIVAGTRFEANPQFNTAVGMFVLGIGGLFVLRAIPEPVYEDLSRRLRNVVST